MSGLKPLRNRIKTIKSTQKITKAMHIVSAAKLAKIKDKAAKLDDFSRILSNMICHVSKEYENNVPQEYKYFFGAEMSELPHLLLIFTTERGLCGSFNSSIIKKAKADIEEYKKSGQKFRLIIIGKKGISAFKENYTEFIDHTYHIIGDNYELVAQEIKKRIIGLVESKQIGSCFAYYNEFQNALVQILSKEQILPAKIYREVDIENVFDFEGESIIGNLINLYMYGEIKYILLQNKASEEGARMTTMDNSTKNAKELIDKLTSKLNRSRQALITTELCEIIAGAEAL
ncbi:MAG: ATP synthase F1 subunit gamma [Rickettsiaceae bacterium]|nr:ATP synthase F1 subunit gamma [Rickettsiaceae bacterium]